MRERSPRIAAALFASLLVAPPCLPAQANLAHVDDAGAPPRGLLRLRVLSAWTRYDSRFTDNGSTPLGAPYTSEALGTNKIPELAPIETAVQSASASPFTLSLGNSKLNATAREVILPFALEYGITNRLSIGVTVPVVQKRARMLFVLDSTGSNVGPNPGLTSATADQVNRQVQTEFASAISQLQARLQSCQSNPAGPGCATIIGREAEAQALIEGSQAFAATLGELFGSATLSGMVFVPRTTSAAHTSIAERVRQYNLAYRDFLAAPADLLVGIPVGAGGGVGSDEFTQYLTEDLGRDSLRSQEHIGIGDVEIGVRFLAIDAPATEERRRGLTLALASNVRLPTGSTESRGELVDVSLGDGGVVIDSRAIVDARVGRFGVLAVGQYIALVGDAPTGIVPERAYAPESFGQSTRSTQIHVAPRWHLSEPFAFHAAYSLRSTDKSGGDQLVGGGVSFSTLAAYRAGTTKAIPMEMRFTHLEAIAGDPARPKFFRDQIEVRIYYRLRR
jgi:hypothetical protein